MVASGGREAAPPPRPGGPRSHGRDLASREGKASRVPGVRFLCDDHAFTVSGAARSSKATTCQRDGDWWGPPAERNGAPLFPTSPPDPAAAQNAASRGLEGDYRISNAVAPNPQT